MSRRKLLGDRYRVGDVIGSGAFSTVYYCHDLHTNERLAVKVLSKAMLKEAEMEDAFEREIASLKATSLIQSPHICNLIETLSSSNNYYLIIELADGGTLLNMVAKNGGLPGYALRKYFLQCLRGLIDIHAAGVVHRDIKPENLLLDEYRELKVADFSFAACADDTRVLKRQCGSPHYVAPEVLTGKGYNGRKADVWSLGVTLFVMAYGVLPFVAPTTDKLYQKILSGKFNFPERSVNSQKVPESLQHLISVCLRVDPSRRWTLHRVRQHPWVHGKSTLPRLPTTGCPAPPLPVASSPTSKAGKELKKEDSAQSIDEKGRTKDPQQLEDDHKRKKASTVVAARDNTTSSTSQLDVQGLMSSTGSGSNYGMMMSPSSYYALAKMQQQGGGDGSTFGLFSELSFFELTTGQNLAAGGHAAAEDPAVQDLQYKCADALAGSMWQSCPNLRTSDEGVIKSITTGGAVGESKFNLLGGNSRPSGSQFRLNVQAGVGSRNASRKDLKEKSKTDTRSTSSPLEVATGPQTAGGTGDHQCQTNNNPPTPSSASSSLLSCCLNVSAVFVIVWTVVIFVLLFDINLAKLPLPSKIKELIEKALTPPVVASPALNVRKSHQLSSRDQEKKKVMKRRRRVPGGTTGMTRNRTTGGDGASTFGIAAVTHAQLQRQQRQPQKTTPPPQTVVSATATGGGTLVGSRKLSTHKLSTPPTQTTHHQQPPPTSSGADSITGPATSSATSELSVQTSSNDKELVHATTTSATTILGSIPLAPASASDLTGGGVDHQKAVAPSALAPVEIVAPPSSYILGDIQGDNDDNLKGSLHVAETTTGHAVNLIHGPWRKQIHQFVKKGGRPSKDAFKGLLRDKRAAMSREDSAVHSNSENFSDVDIDDCSTGEDEDYNTNTTGTTTSDSDATAGEVSPTKLHHRHHRHPKELYELASTTESEPENIGRIEESDRLPTKTPNLSAQFPEDEVDTGNFLFSSESVDSFVAVSEKSQSPLAPPKSTFGIQKPEALPSNLTEGGKQLRRRKVDPSRKE